jgi:hypothetical protein
MVVIKSVIFKIHIVIEKKGSGLMNENISISFLGNKPLPEIFLIGPQYAYVLAKNCLQKCV